MSIFWLHTAKKAMVPHDVGKGPALRVVLGSVSSCRLLPSQTEVA